MTGSIRSAMAFCAALAVTAVAPAQAGSGQQPPALLATATLPKVAVPDLLNDSVDPPLAGDQAPDASAPDASAPDASAPDQAPAASAPSSAPSAAPTADARPSGDLPAMIAALAAAEPGSRELECLATGIYFESKSEPLAGQLAVGHVISNRSKSGRFPSSYCGVLFQRGQFSFVHGASLPAVPHSSKQWRTAVAIAKIVDQGLKDSAVGKALFFHARSVSPGWRLKRVAAIGNHIFYR